jgi:hypothetical protein
VKGYFWANLKGTIINWEVRRFRLYRNARPMDILWEGALETGAVDEILLVVSPDAAHLGRVLNHPGLGTQDRLEDQPTYPEAFLTVTDGRRLRGAKFRLQRVHFEWAFHALADEPSQDPYVRKTKRGSITSASLDGPFQILVGLDKVERVRVALPGM